MSKEVKEIISILETVDLDTTSINDIKNKDKRFTTKDIVQAYSIHRAKRI